MIGLVYLCTPYLSIQADTRTVISANLMSISRYGLACPLVALRSRWGRQSLKGRSAAEAYDQSREGLLGFNLGSTHTTSAQRGWRLLGPAVETTLGNLTGSGFHFILFIVSI